MGRRKRLFLVVLILLNAVVLLGQLWPEGAPPFARSVNILFLCLTLGWFVREAFGKARSAGSAPS